MDFRVLGLLAGLAIGPAAAAPARVMSINLCTDGLLLALLPAGRIASVTWLARDPAQSPYASAAAGVPVNHGTAEEVLAAHPDLVLAGSATTPATRALLARLGVPMLVLPPAEDFAAIRAQTRTVAAAVGAQPAGAALIARMDGTLAALARTPPEPAPRVLAWDGDGSVPGPDSLFGAILHAAGGVEAMPAASRSVDVEQAAWSGATLLAQEDGNLAAPSARAVEAAHPLLRRLFAGRTIAYPEAMYRCGLPSAAEAALQLRRQFGLAR